MERVEMIRLEKGVEGTFGALRMDGRVVCVTLEPPDRNNEQDVSCIPVGSYRCRRVRSPAFGTTYEVADVPGRTHILFHKGNLVDDTRGCVLLGSRYGELDGRRGVLRSGAAFAEFMNRCGEAREFELKVREL